MWTLFRMHVAPIGLSDQDQQARAKAISDVKNDIAQSRRVLEEIAGMMAQMAASSHEETPEYKRILTAYQNLSRLVTEASRELKTREDQQARDMRATQPLAGSQDFTGIVPIKATIGPGGRAGVVANGPEVQNLQKFLAVVGFTVPVSGDYDVKTKLAVQQFQSKYGLAQDGMVGASMRKVINDMIKQA